MITLPQTPFEHRLVAICRTKTPYRSKQRARDAARILRREFGHGSVYECRVCEKWHITKSNAENVRRHQREDSGAARAPIERPPVVVDEVGVIAAALLRVFLDEDRARRAGQTNSESASPAIGLTGGR